MRFFAWLLLIISLISSGCVSPPPIDIVILDTQLQNGQKAISDAAELGAEQLATDEYSRALKLLKFALQAQERGDIAQSMEYAYQAELVANIALYETKQQLARAKLISIQEQLYQEIITQKDYEIEMLKIRHEMKAAENAQALKEIEVEKKRAGSLTSDLAQANDATRKAVISIHITGAEIVVNIAKRIYPEIVETAEYERVQATITQAKSQLERKEFEESEKIAKDAQTQADKLFDLATQNQKNRATAETIALIAIERAKLKIQRAETLNAATHDPKQFQQTQSQLDKAKKELQAKQYSAAQQNAEIAEQIADKVITTSEIAEYRQRAQQELAAKIKRAESVVATLKTSITEQSETKVPQIAPQLFELATSALATAEGALAKKEYDATINSAQQGSDYIQRAIEKTQLQNSIQTSLVEATKQIPKAVIIELEEGVIVRVSGNLFASTSTRLKEEFFPTFIKLAAILQQDEFTGYVAKIEGHSDTLGPAAANKALTKRRANAVKTFLIERGKIPENRMTAVGLGESQLIDEESHEKNRRIDITISRAPE